MTPADQPPILPPHSSPQTANPSPAIPRPDSDRATACCSNTQYQTSPAPAPASIPSPIFSPSPHSQNTAAPSPQDPQAWQTSNPSAAHANTPPSPPAARSPPASEYSHSPENSSDNKAKAPSPRPPGRYSTAALPPRSNSKIASFLQSYVLVIANPPVGVVIGW